MVGKSMCKGNRAIAAYVYIRKCRFTKADSDSRFQVSDRNAVIYIHKSRFRLQISGFRPQRGDIYYTFTKADSDCRFQVSGGDPLLTDDRQIERRIEKLQQGRGKGELDRT